MENAPSVIKDYILVQMPNAADKTAGGITIPQKYRKKPKTFGKVLRVGPDVATVRPGMIVVFDVSESREIPCDNALLNVVVEESVYAYYDDEDAALEAGFSMQQHASARD